jgi:hypothetical protein
MGLLAAWFAGDVFKTAYAYMTDAPLQFLLCGAVQIMFDCILTAQARRAVCAPDPVSLFLG